MYTGSKDANAPPCRTSLAIYEGESWGREVEEDLKRAHALASDMDGLELAILVKVGDEGQLFESINSQKIVEKLKEM